MEKLTVPRDHYEKMLEGSQKQNDKLVEINQELERSLEETTQKFLELMTSNQSLDKNCEELRFHNQVLKEENSQKGSEVVRLERKQEEMGEELESSVETMKEIAHMLQLRDNEINEVIATSEHDTLSRISKLEKQVEVVRKRLTRVRQMLRSKKKVEKKESDGQSSGAGEKTTRVSQEHSMEEVEVVLKREIESKMQ